MKKLIAVLTFIILVGVTFMASRGSVEYNYTIEGRDGITDKQVEDIKVRIDKIYGYLNNLGYETKEVRIVIGEYSKFKRDKNEIVIDINTDDFQLMKVIMRYQFSDYTNYGLLYGTMYDMALKSGFDFEEVKSFSIDDIQAYWKHIYISYINFNPEIAEEDEIEISKYVSAEFVKYIKEEYGNEYFLNLIEGSHESFNSNKVNELLNTWMKSKDGEFSCDKPEERLNFDIYSEEGKIEYKGLGINWTIHLSGHEITQRFLDIYDSTEIFYEYMGYLYDEIHRLNNIFENDNKDLIPLSVEFYSKIEERYRGFTKQIGDKEIKIDLRGIDAFSHEYVHYMDLALGVKWKQWIGEVRAEYFSRYFAMKEKRVKGYLGEVKKRGKEQFDIYKEVEEYIQRENDIEEYYGLFNDLLVNKLIKEGKEIPDLQDCSGDYPFQYWWSLSNYIVRNYGEEAMYTVLINEEQPDGSEKRVDDVIEEWKEYISNISKEDYSDYYK